MNAFKKLNNFLFGKLGSNAKKVAVVFLYFAIIAGILGTIIGTAIFYGPIVIDSILSSSAEGGSSVLFQAYFEMFLTDANLAVEKISADVLLGIGTSNYTSLEMQYYIASKIYELGLSLLAYAPCAFALYGAGEIIDYCQKNKKDE